MQAQNWKCCHIKLWRIIKESSVWQALNIICILFYCGLYTMTIDIVTWRIIKKWCILSLHLHNFLCLSVFALFLQKIRRLSRNSNFIYIYIYIYLKLKLGTEKHIWLSLSAVKWEPMKPTRRPSVSLVIETLTFLWTFSPLISGGPLLRGSLTI